MFKFRLVQWAWIWAWTNDWPPHMFLDDILPWSSHRNKCLSLHSGTFSLCFCKAYLLLQRWWLVRCSCCPSQPWCWWCTAFPASGPPGWETPSYPGLPPQLYGRPQTRRRLGKSPTWPEGVSTSASTWFPSPPSPSVPWEHRALITKESETVTSRILAAWNDLSNSFLFFSADSENSICVIKDDQALFIWLINFFPTT